MVACDLRRGPVVDDLDGGRRDRIAEICGIEAEQLALLAQACRNYLGNAFLALLGGSIRPELELLSVFAHDELPAAVFDRGLRCVEHDTRIDVFQAGRFEPQEVYLGVVQDSGRKLGESEGGFFANGI